MGRIITRGIPFSYTSIILIVFALSISDLARGESTHRLRAYRPYYTSVFKQQEKQAQVDEVINHHGSRLRREEVHGEPEEEILPAEYDPYVPPYPRDDDEPDFGGETTVIVSDISDLVLHVNASILVFNVRDINEVSEDYNLEVNLRLYWRDDRLAHSKLSKDKLKIAAGYDYAVLNPRLIEKLWTPDIFIEHVKNTSQPAFISKPSSLRIYPDGDVRYSARMTIKMSCQMDFTYYPADTQACVIGLRSFSFKMDKMHLAWQEDPGIVKEFMSHSFDIRVSKGAQREDANPFSRRGRKFWRLEFYLLLRRKLAFHLWQTFFPSTLFVVTSWTSFWVPPEIVSARTTVCMSALLTQTMMFSSVRQNTPNESYAKALDVWMLVCMFFGFLTLLEYTLILKFNSLKMKKRPKQLHDDDHMYHWFDWKKINFNILHRKEEEEELPSITPVSHLSWQYIDGKDIVPYHIRRPKLRKPSGNGNTSPHSMTTSFDYSSSSGSASIHQRSLSPPPKGSPQPSSTDSATTANNNTATKAAEDELIDFKKYTIRMDRISRFAFPGAFLFFNAIYWPTLLLKANYYSF